MKRPSRKTAAIVLGVVCGVGVSVGWMVWDGSLLKGVLNGLIIILFTILFVGNSSEQ